MYQKTALTAKNSSANNIPFSFSKNPCHAITATELYNLITTIETPPDESIESYRNTEDMSSMAAFLASPVKPVKMVSHSATVDGGNQRASSSSSSEQKDYPFLIIDVRDPSLFDRYALLSSINFPKTDYMVKDRILGDLYIARNKKQQIILVDQGTPFGVQNTCNDAEQVGNKLVLTGFFTDVYVLTGGLVRMAQEFPYAFEGPDVPHLIKLAQDYAVTKLPKRVPLTAPRGTKLVQGKLVLPSSSSASANLVTNNSSTKPKSSSSLKSSFGSPSSTAAVSTDGIQNDVPSIASILHPKNTMGRSNSIVSQVTMKTTMTNTTAITTNKSTSTSPVKGAVCVSLLGNKNHSTFGTSNRFAGSGSRNL